MDLNTEKKNFAPHTVKWFTVISVLVIIGAFLVACMISMLSEFGKHPDEYDVRACMDWCMNRWIWPDMRQMGTGLGNTYSGYGYTKVCNYTPYFLIFSKISRIFMQFMGDFPYFRVPNLILMAIMTVYIVRKLRDNNWLMLGFGICVQAWYIFSYVTADAEDFLLAFIGIAMLADRDSLLWKTVGTAPSPDGPNRSALHPVDLHPTDVHCIISCILLGILYGLMLLGKPYYYATLVLTLIVLTHSLIKSEINNRKRILTRYILILVVALAIWGGRALLDVHYYGLDKAQAKAEMSAMYSDYDKNPTTPVEEQAPTYHMASKGYALTELFEYQPKWFALSYKTYVAASIYYDGHMVFFTIMAILYIAIYSSLGIYLCRNGDTPLFILVTVLNVGSVAASVLNSWLIDCQPQGRYLLPIALSTCYLGSRARGLWEKRAFCLTVLTAACISLLFFGLVETRTLIDLGYVRELLRL